jgi:hypothetical protein
MIVTYAPNWSVIYNLKFMIVNLLKHRPQSSSYFNFLSPDLQSGTAVTSGGSEVVVYLPHHPSVKGLSTDTSTDTGGKITGESRPSKLNNCHKQLSNLLAAVRSNCQIAFQLSGAAVKLFSSCQKHLSNWLATARTSYQILWQLPEPSIKFYGNYQKQISNC